MISAYNCYEALEATIPPYVLYEINKTIESVFVTIQEDYAAVYNISCTSIRHNIEYAKREQLHCTEQAIKTPSAQDAAFYLYESQHWSQMTQILERLDFIDD